MKILPKKEENAAKTPNLRGEQEEQTGRQKEKPTERRMQPKHHQQNLQDLMPACIREMYYYMGKQKSAK